MLIEAIEEAVGNGQGVGVGAAGQGQTADDDVEAGCGRSVVAVVVEVSLVHYVADLFECGVGSEPE